MSGPAGVAADQLRSIVERVERLAEERKSLADDIAEIYMEARGNGFDVPAIKAVVRKRAKGAAEVEEFEAIVALYEAALGGGVTTGPVPLGSLQETLGGRPSRARAREASDV